jgi:uncharacterized protein (TIGR03067 family)
MRLATALLLLLIACFLCLSTTVARDTQDDLKLLQGEWRVVAMENDGVRSSRKEITGVRWEFRGTTLQVAEPDEELHPWASVRLDSTKNPKQMELIPSLGPHKGTSVPGIFKIEHDRLYVCSGEKPTDERPTEFSAAAESSRCLIVLERASK